MKVLFDYSIEGQDSDVMMEIAGDEDASVATLREVRLCNFDAETCDLFYEKFD